MPDIKHRRSIRLKDYNYSSPGAYFITICTHNRECIFGEIGDAVMHMNDDGRIAESAWNDLPNHYDHVSLDAFIVMPNHVHVLIRTYEGVLLGKIVQSWKGHTGRRIRPLAATIPELVEINQQIVRRKALCLLAGHCCCLGTFPYTRHIPIAHMRRIRQRPVRFSNNGTVALFEKFECVIKCFRKSRLWLDFRKTTRCQ